MTTTQTEPVQPDDASPTELADWKVYKDIKNTPYNWGYKGLTSSELDQQAIAWESELPSGRSPRIEDVITEVFHEGQLDAALRPEEITTSDLSVGEKSLLLIKAKHSSPLLRSWMAGESIEHIDKTRRELRNTAEHYFRHANLPWVQVLKSESETGQYGARGVDGALTLHEFLKFRIYHRIDSDLPLGPVPQTTEGQQLHQVVFNALAKDGFAVANKLIEDLRRVQHFSHPLLRTTPEAIKNYESLEAQLFADKEPRMSQLEGFESLTGFLNFAVQTRRNLEGDDTTKIMDILDSQRVSSYAINRIFRKNVRYVLVEAPNPIGRVRITPTSFLPGETPVLMKRDEPGRPHSVIIRAPNEGLPQTNYATFVIGDDENGPELITAFTGLPTPPFHETFPSVEGPVAATLRSITQTRVGAENAQFAVFMPAETFDREYAAAPTHDSIRAARVLSHGN